MRTPKVRTTLNAKPNTSGLLRVGGLWPVVLTFKKHWDALFRSMRVRKTRRPNRPLILHKAAEPAARNDADTVLANTPFLLTRCSSDLRYVFGRQENR